MAEAYRVFFVLDRDYGERLLELARSGPVWIVDTPQNRAVAQNLWAANPNRNHLEGATTFKAGQDCSNEETLINELDTIDLLHEQPQERSSGCPVRDHFWVYQCSDYVELDCDLAFRPSRHYTQRYCGANLFPDGRTSTLTGVGGKSP